MSKVFLFCIVILFPSFASSQSGTLEGHYLIFYKIDNKVKILVNGDTVYVSDVIDGNPDLNLEVSIESALTKGINEIRIELYNGSDINDFISDTNWEIRYEIFNNDDSIDYMHQFSKNGTEGLAFKYFHEIYKR